MLFDFEMSPLLERRVRLKSWTAVCAKHEDNVFSVNIYNKSLADNDYQSDISQIS